MSQMKKIEKILLMEPPVTLPEGAVNQQRMPVVPPLGVSYVAAVLEKLGYEVKVIDCLVEGFLTPTPSNGGMVRYGLTDQEIQRRISDFSPHVVGVSCVLTNKYKDAHHLCQLVKSFDPSVITIMGGAHPTTFPRLVMDDESVDFAVLGEGDYALPELIERIDKDLGFDDFDGLAFRKGNTVVVNEKIKFIEDLDSLPFPARHLLPMKLYSQISQPHGDFLRMPFTTMITSRGCPARCIFCSALKLWGKKYRIRSAENVLAEIKMLVDTYGIREIHFEDDNMTYNIQRAKQIFKGVIDQKFNISWCAPNGLAVFALDEDTVTLMKQSGCFSVAIAIESGSQEVLDHIVHKPLNLAKVKPLVEKMRSIGLHTKGFFIIGFPDETRKQIQETMDFAKNVGLDWVALNIATPLPGTTMFDRCKEKGYLVGDFELSKLKYTIGSIKTTEFDPEYLQGLWQEINLSVNFLNNINMRERKYDVAIRDFNRVIKFYPHHEIAHLCLAQCYDEKGKSDEAIREYQEVLKINPLNKTAMQRLKELSVAS